MRINAFRCFYAGSFLAAVDVGSKRSNIVQNRATTSEMSESQPLGQGVAVPIRQFADTSSGRSARYGSGIRHWQGERRFAWNSSFRTL